MVFLLPIPNRLVEFTWYAQERKNYHEKITASPESIGSIPEPSFHSLIPSGWPMIIKNTANAIIARIFADTVFNFQENLAGLAKYLIDHILAFLAGP